MVAVIFGVIIGLALGLTGGGGSVFAIPLLVFGLGLEPVDAITISLVAVVIMASVGVLSTKGTGLVEYKAAGIFAAGGILSAPLGVQLGNLLAQETILTSFALLMAVVAVSMWQKASRSPTTAAVVRSRVAPDNTTDRSGPVCRLNPRENLRLSTPCSLVLALSGIITGVLSGLFGVGGGFIIVPALMLVTQLPIQRAVATSLLVICLVGTSGVIAAFVTERQIPLHVTLLFLSGGIVGMLVGRLLAGRLAGPLLQKIFAVMMVLVAAVTLSSRL